MVLMVALSLTACATTKEPFEYQSDNEAKQGRGVFTGEQGTWTIFRQEKPAEPQAVPPEEVSQAESETEAVEEDQTAPASSSPDG